METILNQLEVALKTNGITFAQVLVIGVGGVLLSNFICKKLGRIASRSDYVETTAAHFVLTIVKILLYAGVFFLVAAQLGVSTGSIVSELGLLAAAVALSLKDTIASVANGIMIVTTHPFSQGDRIVVGGVDGVVKSIRLFNTELTTFDNQVVIVPNQTILNNSLTNYSTMPTRRVTVVANVAYGADVDEVKRILAGVVARTANILKTPAPFIRMTAMGASSIDFTVRVWTYTDKFMDVTCDLNEGVYKALNAAGVEIPFTQMDVHLRDLPPVRLNGAQPDGEVSERE